MKDLATTRLNAFMIPAAAVGAGFLLLSLIELFVDREQFFRSWLYAWLLFLGIALGAKGIVMLQHLIPSEWGLLVRRTGEAASLTLPVLLILGLPLALGLSYNFPWARAGEVAHDAVLEHRRPLFNTWAFLIRALVYFVIWIAIAWRLRVLSLRLDRHPTDTISQSLRRLSAFGMVLYFLTMSSAAVDWIMSREAHWYSSVFGFIVTMAQGLSAIAFIILIIALLHREPPMDTAARPSLLHDLGNLLLMMVVLWAYVSFSQLLVIWLGNGQQEIPWYIHRSKGFWRFITVLLVVFQFFAPFVLLLLQSVKRHPRSMAWVAGGVLFMQWINALWMIAPSSVTAVPHRLSWCDFVTPIGIGGIWFASFLWWLRRAPLLPVGISTAVKPFNHGPNDVKIRTVA
jgi:hypothetical protein